MNTTSDSNSNLGNQTLGRIRIGIGLSIACLVMFAVVTYISYVCRRVHGGDGGPTNYLNRRSLASMNAAAAASPDSSTVSNQCNGLDEATLATYPLFAYSEIGAHKINESYTSGCSVCLADYKGADLVRSLPSCGHLFHVKCIDPWLMLHPTCPVCRSSPLVTNITPGM